jgi:predicted PurR-regulated permease PerM
VLNEEEEEEERKRRSECRYNQSSRVAENRQLRTTRLTSRSHMDPREHIHVTGFALKNWAIAQVQDSIAVALLWLAGLWILKVPWAPLWAVLAAALQIVPHLGPVLSLVGPMLAALLRWHDWEHPLYVLILYAVIVVVDGLLLQPYIMRRVAKVPMWASILVPIVLGFAIPFWGFILAPPLLAVIYAYKARQRA